MGSGMLEKGDLVQLLKEDIAEDEDDEEYRPSSDEELVMTHLLIIRMK